MLELMKNLILDKIYFIVRRLLHLYLKSDIIDRYYYRK